jgi:NTP pyrophosphatase (non-canonical NTP hydrolase)
VNDADYMIASERTDTKDYESVADRMLLDKKIVAPDRQVLQLLHGTMGVCTESGELMDAVKRFLIYGKPTDVTNIMEEVGDMFWYLALIARCCGFTFEEAKAKNIAKLRARYPEKFTELAALNRNLDAELKALGGTDAL